MSQTEIEKLILKETKGLSQDALNEILDFVGFIKMKLSVRKKKKTPNPASVRDVHEFRKRISKSLMAIERGEVLSDEELDKKIKSW